MSEHAIWTDVSPEEFEDFHWNETENTHAGKEKKVSKGKKGDALITALKFIVALLFIALLAEGIIVAFVNPLMSPAKIKVSGIYSLSLKEITEPIEEIADVSWAKFNTKAAVTALSAVSGIESVSVDKQFPDKILISVKERQAVAKTVADVEGFSIPFQIDRNGVIFTSKSLSASSDSSVPLISGLPAEFIAEGKRLPGRYHSLMEQISQIQRLPQKYFAAISEIQVVSKEYGNYELVLYPINSKIRVLCDRSLNENALKYMIVALDVVNSIDPEVNEVDLRYGSVSYRKR